MLKISVHVDDNTRMAIGKAYGKDDYATVENVVADIVRRYLNADHFDSGLNLDDKYGYDICRFCGEVSRRNRMIDIDGTNLVERGVCENCGSGYPEMG